MALLPPKVPKTAAEAGSGPRLLVTSATSSAKQLGYTKTLRFCSSSDMFVCFAKQKQTCWGEQIKYLIAHCYYSGLSIIHINNPHLYFLQVGVIIVFI